MNKRQQARLASYRSVSSVFDQYPDETATVPALARSVATFRDLLAQLETAADDQGDYAPRGPVKTARRQALATAAVPIAQALSFRAEETDDPATAAQYDHSPTDYLQGPEQEALSRARNVAEAARAIPDDELADVGLAPTELDALETAIDAYAAALPAPRNEIVARRVETAAIDRLDPAITDHLRRRVDRLMVRHKGTPFGDAYETARTIVDRGSRPSPDDAAL